MQEDDLMSITEVPLGLDANEWHALHSTLKVSHESSNIFSRSYRIFRAHKPALRDGVGVLQLELVPGDDGARAKALHVAR